MVEAATRVYAFVRDGRGPDENFRAYFLATVRTVALDAHARDLRVVPAELGELDALAEPVPAIEPDDSDDSVVLVREAFRLLPERDRRVLWHTTVEGRPRGSSPPFSA